MKTVWVNRHNADGTVKPMSEWARRECEDYQDFYYTIGDVIVFCRKDERRWTLEEFNIGNLDNQSGDGYFNVEDEQPPIGVPVLILRDAQYTCQLTIDDIAIGEYAGNYDCSLGHTFELSEGGCWFLERCDTLLWHPIPIPTKFN